MFSSFFRHQEVAFSLSTRGRVQHNLQVHGSGRLGLCNYLSMTVAILTQPSVFDKIQKCSKHARRNCHFQMIDRCERHHHGRSSAHQSILLVAFLQERKPRREGHRSLSHGHDAMSCERAPSTGADVGYLLSTHQDGWWGEGWAGRAGVSLQEENVRTCLGLRYSSLTKTFSC